MLLIAGTVPLEEVPLIKGAVHSTGDHILVEGCHIPCTQGTGVMLSAALAATNYLKLEAPYAILAGDIGEGEGSRAIYEYLIQNISELSPDVLALHYWLPNMSLTRQLCGAVDACRNRPLLIADAASMYSAKAAKVASSFDIFTPDATEIAFLADPYATHPAYINRHLFNADITRTPSLVEDAYKHKGAAKLLLVKGAIDYIADESGVIATVDKPDIPALEAVGGTGDTITGLVAAFVYAGLKPHEAAIFAARSNRVAGEYAGVTPATKSKKIVNRFHDVFKDHLCQWSGICSFKGGNSDD
jgi:NAD(P)H-hydrate repair Nnr-like enzyme with NAD(P)H-hydrate dehydratase domain